MDLMEKEHAYQISQMNEFLPSALPMDMNTPPRPVKQTMVSTPSSPAPLSPTTASLLAAGIGPLSPPTTAPAPAPAPSRKIPLLGSLLGLAGVSVAGITSSSTPVSKESHPLSGGNNNSNNDIGGLNVSVSGSTDKDAQIFTLMNALKAKCDQYIKLRAAHVDQSLHISALESALTDANRRFNESQVGPQRKIQELEEKLARTELLSKQFVDNKKIDSGRLFALRGGSNIAKPAMIVSLQGGGKRISNAISSSSLSSSSSSSSSYNNNNNNNNNNNKNDNPSSPSAPIAASINNRRSSGGFFARLTGTSSNNNNNPTSPRSNDTNKPQSPEIKLTSMGSLRGNMSNNNNNNNNNSSDSTNNNE